MEYKYFDNPKHTTSFGVVTQAPSKWSIVFKYFYFADNPHKFNFVLIYFPRFQSTLYHVKILSCQESCVLFATLSSLLQKYTVEMDLKYEPFVSRY